MRTPSLGLNLPRVKPETEAPAVAPTTGNGAGAALEGFGQALNTAIQGLNESQSAADNASVSLAAGEPVDLHEVMLARETASLHFQLAVQVRNKLIEAYQDVMRMQV
ncbi:MAG: flagellar hook-basal body complex protein FliE [Chloroflexi bacterium]|nr:flagellar hook-basal body complex protein FliE [Chloroflexota bacterium]